MNATMGKKTARTIHLTQTICRLGGCKLSKNITFYQSPYSEPFKDSSWRLWISARSTDPKVSPNYLALRTFYSAPLRYNVLPPHAILDLLPLEDSIFCIS